MTIGRVAAFVVTCTGCGYRAPADDPFPIRCPRSGSDEGDHVMSAALCSEDVQVSDHPNPFIRYRMLLYPYGLARALGVTDGHYVEVVERLDAAVARVDGRGLAVTPFDWSGSLSDGLGLSEPGGVWVKDETGNVAGSHKVRHLMGLAVHLALAEEAGAPWRGILDPTLGIASCGNAALAAAVVARAAGRRLDVFVPAWTDPRLLARLGELEARVVVCPREAGVPGDPAYHHLQQAILNGVFPFTCQGPANGLTIEGGKTIGFEMVSVLEQAGASLDRLLLQVGGGALASACVSAFRDAAGFGAVRRLPRIHAVQTQAIHPLARAYDKIKRRILGRLAREHGIRLPDDASEQTQADLIAAGASLPIAGEELRYAARHRAEFMWPWEKEARSVASGIVDDETYDWLAVVRAMLETGGYPVLIDEETTLDASRLARRATGISVSPTGAAGLAGLLGLRRTGQVRPQERVGLIFTGVQC